MTPSTSHIDDGTGESLNVVTVSPSTNRKEDLHSTFGSPIKMKQGVLADRQEPVGGEPLFYIGLHHPGDAKHFERSCISINTLTTRRKPIGSNDTFVDSAGFVTIDLHGGYPESPETYARHLHRLDTQGVVRITVAASQDYMCEPHMLAKTGLTVADHQRLTIERYDAILAELHGLYDGPPPFHLLPVLQGWKKADYVDHIRQYGDRLKAGMWVGVGSVCKRQASIVAIEDILSAIKGARPDLRLHGFRSEADSSAQPSCPEAALQRGQHGVVVCGGEGLGSDDRRPDEAVQAGENPAARRSPLLPDAGKAHARRQRLARGQGLSGRGDRASVRARATDAVRRMIPALSISPAGYEAAGEVSPKDFPA